ncbi:HNH endonuclease signature motif containing protein [Nocardioides sp. C4-1]|uniref:HNH endonuclease signature motif containing protein n=1 Tax=Nocardioides sp. C4-1 TaxID=3151851 RepID=UPI00326319EB
MATSTRTSSDPLLLAVRGRRLAEADAQVETLKSVLAWAERNVASSDEVVVLLQSVERPLHLAGPGAPAVPEYAALDLALSLGMSTDAGLTYLGRALELAHRLPRLYLRVVKHEVALWRAFKITDATMTLSETAAWHVDKAITPVAERCSFAQLDRTVDAARAEHDPAEAEARRLAALEDRRVTVYLAGATTDGTDGTVDVVATLDTADAIDLEHALRDGAQALADLGSTETLDVRRSQALGEMARTQLALDLDTSGTGRGVTIYAHLDAANPDLPGLLDSTQTPLLVEQVREWCQAAGTKVAVKPVIDLAEPHETPAYRPSDAIRERVTLRDRCCVFPDCSRRRVDLDHVMAWESGGITATWNLALLCRRHHRAKTHGRWSYRMVEPGLYAWTSPTGVESVVDRRPPPGTHARRHP